MGYKIEDIVFIDKKINLESGDYSDSNISIYTLVNRVEDDDYTTINVYYYAKCLKGIICFNGRYLSVGQSFCFWQDLDYTPLYQQGVWGLSYAIIKQETE